MSLNVEALCLSHSDIPHLDAVSAKFERGQLTAVLGRTLAGKTTLLRAIAGLQAVESGSLQLDGKPFSDLPAWKRDVAMVYQQFINYPHLTVFENVAFPLRKQRLSKAEIQRRVPDVLATVGLADFGARKPSELSGGQQQRVALARALVRKSEILLLDEPLVNLDYKLREQLRDELRGLLGAQKQAIVIYNTTEPAEAMMIGDRIVIMHEGRIIQAGMPAEVFDRPASVAVAEIINDPPMNIFGGSLEMSGIVLDGGLRLAAGPRLLALPAGRYRFGVRAGEMGYGQGSHLAARVTFSEVSGSETSFHVTGEFGDAVLQIEGVHVLRLGDQARVSIPTDRIFVFEADGEGRLIRAPDPARTS